LAFKLSKRGIHVRRCLSVVLGCAVLFFVMPAFAAGPKLPTVLDRQIRAVKRDRHAPVILLPTSMPLGFVGPHAPAHVHMYPGGGPSGAGYGLELGAVPKCGGVDACFIASFSASKGGKIYPGFTTVIVPGASRAQYHGLLCGGSCSQPQIEYIVHGVLYAIQATLTVPRNKDESTMIAAAEGSIKAGPR
jgi:hypothetical protein